MSNLTAASGDQASVSSGNREHYFAPSTNQAQPVKRKRNLPGNPDPDAEVIALSPKTLMATNRFLCEICNKGFQREQNLQLHRRGHNLPWKRKQGTSIEVRKKVYVCPEASCVHHDPSRALGDLTGIKKHFSRKHGEKKWKCDKCSKRYAVQSDWKAHSKTCGTREYRCDCGTLFSRKDSFIAHRAFCDALAEESASAITENNPLLISSKAGTSTSHLQPHELNNMSNIDLHAFSMKKEQQSFSLRSSEIPPWLACPPPIAGAGPGPGPPPIDLTSSIFTTRSLDQEFTPTQDLTIHENPNPNPNPDPRLGPNLPPYYPTASPHMSATALLQKAAQMGASMSSTKTCSSVPAMIRPHQAGDNTTGFGLHLGSREEMGSGFVHGLGAFGNKAAIPSGLIKDHLSGTSTPPSSLLQDMMNSLSSPSGFEDTFGTGMLNSKKTTNYLSRPNEGGGGNDGKTRDFLGLKPLSHSDIINIPGFSNCMSTPHENQNQTQKSWQDASHSSSSSLPRYEVFLSFSADTCLAFANSLYTALNGVGVHIFRGIEDSHKGDDIVMEAIMESKISIPIFSKKYAYSEKCLWELTQMVECQRSMGQLILPIFYDIDPSNVKHQSGSYKKAFRKHTKHFSERVVKDWKEALREVGELKGWDLNKELSWHRGENFIKENIVPTVLLELKKNYMLVTDCLVGMDYHVKEMMRLLKVDSNEVQIVGIHGISGIGKTTIAKFIYNMLLQCFECCSFLADVQEMVQQNKGVVSLQKQFLADILERCPDIADVDSGIDMIKTIVIKKKVLIVLDDLDESSHFARLVGRCDWFGLGSRIIITTKDRRVLDDLKVDATYEPLLMDYEQSVQLFSMHAFRRKFPPIDYDSISKEVASTVAGIPLALEIVGSFLSSMEKAVWEDTLKKLEKISHDEVEKKLRVIYEALNYAQQQIFLDIACLFTGMDKVAAFYMWDDCGYHPKKELNVLCLMSLVNVGDANELRMHHQLRALGRKIVNEEKIRGNRSRLWNHEDALKIFEGRRGTEKVEALSLHFELGPEKKPRFTGKEFTKLVNLRYLRVDGTNLVGDFEHLLPQLRWLDWRSCSSHFKPTNFHLKNLVILDLSDSGITEDWGGWNQIKMAKKLKVLQLANCALRRTPDFSSYAALEILILRRCKSLVEVDRSIGNLKNLKVLDISYSDIRNIPDEIWMLEKLEVLDFTHCGYLKGHIPSNMGSLTSLRFLSFYDTKIQSLPMSIWELSCLQTLKLGGCTELQPLPQLPSSLRSLDVPCLPNEKNLDNLQELHFVGGCENVEIPRDIWKFSKLEKLTLDSTNVRILPKEISALSQLKVLDVQFCHDLQCILGLPSSLVVLSLAFCYSLERLPNLSNLKILVKLSLRSCIKLTEVQGLGNLESLTRLDIYACDMLANLDLLEQSPCLPSLETLIIQKYEGKEERKRNTMIERRIQLNR